MAPTFSTLPPELQGHILELAAANTDLKNACKLALVSCLAAAWVQPRIFHTIVLDSEANAPRTPEEALASIMLKPPDFLGSNVKRLCITYLAVSSPSTARILHACTGLAQLALWLPLGVDHGNKGCNEDGRLIVDSLMINTSFKRLELGYEHLAEVGRESLQRGAFPGWWATLTHLDVLYWNLAREDRTITIPMLENLVALTHLAIDWRSFVPNRHEPDIQALIASRPTLQALLAYISEADTEWVAGHNPADPRIIYITDDADDFVAEWLDEGPSPGKWEIAEATIQARKQQSVDTSR